LAEAVDRGDVARFASILKSIETARRIEADELRDLRRWVATNGQTCARAHVAQPDRNNPRISLAN
jgi:hypothetical protein